MHKVDSYTGKLYVCLGGTLFFSNRHLIGSLAVNMVFGTTGVPRVAFVPQASLCSHYAHSHATAAIRRPAPQAQCNARDVGLEGSSLVDSR